MKSALRILGIDPGYRLTGYGLIDTNGQSSRHVTHGSIKNTSKDPAERLRNIFSELHTIISQYQPDEMSIEQVFVHRNADSALKLGQARSAAICATFSSKIPVFEYAARAVKQAIVGRGGADKEQVQHMVKILLQYEGEMGLDESDALGIALCHAHSRLLVHGLSFPEQSAGGVSR